MSEQATEQNTSLRAVFAGRRGRLLAALLIAEFAGAVQGIAYATVLPLAARDLDGQSLYGATIAAGSLTTVLVLALGSGVIARLSPRTSLMAAMLLYLAGVALSVTAPAMAVLLAGSIVRGIASGMLAAFGLTAIGALYEDRVRARVLGLFAMVWLLPSLAGPAVNAAIAVWAGWRWAMAWPALLIVIARMLMLRDTTLVPAGRSTGRPALGPGLLVAGGLVVASAATATGGWEGVVLLAVGLVAAVGGALHVVHRAIGTGSARTAVVVAFAGLATAFFGGDGLIPVGVVEGLGRGVVASAVAVGAGLVAWSLTGMRPPGPGFRPEPGTAGTTLVCLALAAEALTQTGLLGTGPALTVAVGAWAVGGAGMGLAYGRLSAQAFDGLPPDAVAGVGTAVAFAETTAVVIGSLLGAGTYSLATGLGAPDRWAIGAGFALVAAVGLAATALAARRG